MSLNIVLMRGAVGLALVGMLTELPIAIFVELISSFGHMDERLFVQFRLILSGAVIVVGGLNIVFNKSSWLRMHTTWLYGLLVLYICFVLLWNGSEMGYQGDRHLSAASFHFPVFYRAVAFAVIGAHMVHLIKFRSVFLIGALVSGSTILYFVDFAILRINVSEYVEGASVGNYQFIGDAFALLSLFIMALYPSTFFRLVVVFSASIVIFLVGSRTSFAIFILAAGTYLGLSLRASVIPLYLIALLIVAVSVATVDIEQLEAINPRMVSIFTDYEDDASVQGRQFLAEQGWISIANSPIWGSFGAQREYSNGAWAGYIHGAASYWQQFGLIPFVIVGFLYLQFVVFSVISLKHRRRSEYALIVLICAYIMYASVISRSFAFSYLHLFFGLLLSFNAINKYGFNGLTGSVSKGNRKRRRKRSVR